jgi:uncharacterized protein
VTSQADLSTVRAQLGREPLPFAAVPVRCRAGRPVVVEQPAATPDGRPFPTRYWLTCPGLVRAIGQLESAGGVADLERRLATDTEVREAFAAARDRHPGPLGVGGTRAPFAVKCLHAHAAFALGAGDYEIGAAIVAAAGGIPDPCCMDAVA